MSPALPLLTALLEVYAAGDIADCRDRPAAESVAARTAALIPPGATVLVLGDTTYPYATWAELQSCYGPTWGVHRATTIAVPGNHDYFDGRTDDFRAYFGTGAATAGYFARELDGWLVIGLDSHLTGESLDRQHAWLETTLAEHDDARCTLAMWHTPLFSSGLHRGDADHMRPFWQLLDRHGAEIVLNGHEHFYEAFEPLDAEGNRFAEGIRSFVVGTGGAQLRGFWRPPFASRARVLSHGVLRLSLDDGTFAWQFLDVDGRTADSGEARCRWSE
jgi:hypothetical protein